MEIIFIVTQCNVMFLTCDLRARKFIFISYHLYFEMIEISRNSHI